MELRRLHIENLRSLERVELELASGWNLFVGANGAGKTTILEAAYLLSHGRSFRTSMREALVRRGAGRFMVFGETTDGGVATRLGFARGAAGVEARVDGDVVPAAELMRRAAVVCFEPGSHELISGPSEERRRFLDWGVFHVEHDFLGAWRRYQRALKQRNVLLRGGGGPDLEAWDEELAAAAAPLTAMRRRYFEAWAPIALDLLASVLPALGAADLSFAQGWEAQASFREVLGERRERDLVRGHTGRGPHRADWTVSFEAAPRREHLSRGQEKLCAFACVLAQARLHAAEAGSWPVLCLDDLASELDPAHQQRAVDLVAGTNAQVLVTGTHESEALSVLAGAARFHVEQGRVTRLL